MPATPSPTFALKRKALQGQVLQQVAMFDRLSDPLFQVTGRKGRIKWANRSACDLLGENLIDKRLSQVLASKELKTALKDLRKTENGEAELIIAPKNLNRQEFRVRLVRLEKKTIYGARTLVALTDVTQILRLQAQRADFVANASHELKTPVAALSGFIETLQQDPKALDTFLPIMAKEAMRMRDLINDLLNLTKTEMETFETPTEWIDVEPLIDQAIDGLAFAFEKRLQKINRIRTPETVQVRADGGALTTVFTNLLQNASKYGPDATEIGVETEMKGVQLLIHFRNAGKGIAPEHIPRLTERFYRVDDGRARKEGGTGLGLAIVKHVLIRHDGKLLIESAAEQGACFTVALPFKSV